MFMLPPTDFVTLQPGTPASGNMAVIAAGTGLGEALLHNVNGRFLPSPSEGGHADFAARTTRELELVAELARAYGRVENERVVSGPGLVNVFRFTHRKDPGRNCPVLDAESEPSELPAQISKTALDGRCPACVDALDMFVSAYGAEAGNLALRSVATAGVYLGGGIAPKILPALRNGKFLDAFLDKEPMVDMLRMMPVSVILNPQAGLIGSAVRAAALAAGRSRSGTQVV